MNTILSIAVLLFPTSVSSGSQYREERGCVAASSYTGTGLVCHKSLLMHKPLRSILFLLTLQILSSFAAAAELPSLDSPSTISGEPTTAVFFAGATTDNGITYTSTFTATELVDITARIQVASAHVGNVGDLYVVVSFEGQLYNQVVGGAFQSWNGAIETLLPVVANKVLATNENLTIVNKLAFGPAGVDSGTLRFFLAYGLGSGIHAYGSVPLSVTIQPALEPEPVPEPAVIANVSMGFSGASGHATSGVPDPAIAVGYDRVVTISNAEVAIYSKSGEVIARKGLHPFFLPALLPGVSSAGDVAAIFDEQSGRYFLSQAAKIQPQLCQPGTCVGFNMVAVSKTATPNSLDPSDWHIFAIDRYLDRTAAGPVTTTNWGDFDKLGVDEQRLVITSLQYRESDGAPMGPKIRLLDKAKLIAGEKPDTWVDVFPDQDSNLFLSGVVPARMLSDSPVFFFAAAAPCGFTVLGIRSTQADPIVTRRSVSLGGTCGLGDWATAGSGRGPQRGGPPLAVSGVGFSVIPVFRDGRLWVAHTWRKDFGSGEVAVIRWAELDVSQWPDSVSVIQQGTLGEDNVWSFFPSLTVDSKDNLIIGYYTTSADQYPALNVSVRTTSDPLGTMRPRMLVKAGTGAAARIQNNRNRFADFSWMALDPVDETSWIHGQYGSSGVWETWVSNIQVADPP